MSVTVDHIRADPVLADATRSARPLLLVSLQPGVSSEMRSFHSVLCSSLRRRLTDLYDVLPRLHLYACKSLHVTVASLSVDTTPAVTSRWVQSLSLSTSPLTSEMGRLTLKLAGCDMFDDGVIVLLWDDGADGQRVRAWRNEVQNADRIPSIVHSTLARWRQQGPVGVQPSQLRPAVRAAFADAVKHAGDVCIDITQLAVVEELKPCMEESICHLRIDLHK